MSFPTNPNTYVTDLRASMQQALDDYNTSLVIKGLFDASIASYNNQLAYLHSLKDAAVKIPEVAQAVIDNNIIWP